MRETPSPLKGRPHSPSCGHCGAVKTGQRFDRKGWLREYHKKTRLLKYGLTQADYDQMLATQGGVCAICKSETGGRWGTFAIDHDHETGKVRGLLCMTCNTMLGRLEKRWNQTMAYLDV